MIRTFIPALFALTVLVSCVANGPYQPATKPEKIEFLIRQREKSVAIPNGRPKVLSLHRKIGKEIVVVVAKILFV